MITIFRASIVALCVFMTPLVSFGQKAFNAWLTTCAHLEGPTGDTKGFSRAVQQLAGTNTSATPIDWDILLDAGDWTASQHPPTHEEGQQIAQHLRTILANKRGRYFSVAGNHDGEAKGWQPGSFAQRYINPLGDPTHQASSQFSLSERPNEPDYQLLLTYPGTRWDRYLVKTGNVIWIMLGDRNEFDELALQRGDFSGKFQAGRGSAAGMPKGGYPSGAVTLDTFQWWKQVVENPAFKEFILITVHHHMLAFTTTTTEDGEPGEYHGKSGSMGPNGETGGQLYWVREYDQKGVEINQYAQTRPFEDYLKDHPGAIAAWIGGHSHIHTPESKTSDFRGIQINKYGVNFISIGALTTSHQPGLNQMSRLLTFVDGQDHALLTPYIHRSAEKRSLGLDTTATYRIALGKVFRAPITSKNDQANTAFHLAKTVPVDTTTMPYRYQWKLDANKDYDFNSSKWIVGEDGSPYGHFRKQRNHTPLFTTDPTKRYSKVLPINKTQSVLAFDQPYATPMNWKSVSVVLNAYLFDDSAQDLLVATSTTTSEKFRLSISKGKLLWNVGMTTIQTPISSYVNQWCKITAIADAQTKQIRLLIDGKEQAVADWSISHLPSTSDATLIVGAATKGKGWLLQSLTIDDKAPQD